MVTAQITATDLESYYAQLVAAQQKAHGVDYTAHHDVIRRCAKECASYAELGVRQGTTLACAVLAGFREVVGVDRDIAPFRPFWPLFQNRGYGVRVLEQDSRIPLLYPVDFLFVDSDHRPEHLREELAAHGDNVRKFLLVHDTASVPALFHELERFALTSGWTVAQRSSRSVGWTLLRRR